MTRQGVVANILNLFRNGAVGFIDWLGGWRDWSRRDDGFLRGIQRVLDQFPASILLAYHVATKDAVPGWDVALASVSISQRMA